MLIIHICVRQSFFQLCSRTLGGFEKSLWFSYIKLTKGKQVLHCFPLLWSPWPICWSVRTRESTWKRFWHGICSFHCSCKLQLCRWRKLQDNRKRLDCYIAIRQDPRFATETFKEFVTIMGMKNMRWDHPLIGCLKKWE